jgi:hypothetical protein
MGSEGCQGPSPSGASQPSTAVRVAMAWGGSASSRLRLGSKLRGMALGLLLAYTNSTLNVEEPRLFGISGIECYEISQLEIKLTIIEMINFRHPYQRGRCTPYITLYFSSIFITLAQCRRRITMMKRELIWLPHSRS